MINIPWKNCEQCPLSKRHGVGYDGNIDNPVIAFIGMSYGYDEDRIGKPFQGKAGKCLHKNISANGLDPLKDVCYFNVISCMPPKNRTEPTKEEINFCADNLDYFLEVTKPKVIVALGNVALKRLTGKSKISEKRGKVFETKYGIVIPSFHPASVDRTPENEPFIFADINLAKDIATNGLNNYFEQSKKTETIMLLNVKDIKNLADELINSDDFSFDIETTGLHFWDELLGISFAMSENKGYYIPFVDYKENDKKRTQIEVFNKTDKLEIFQILKKVFEKHTGWKYAHNAKFDWKKLYYDWKIPLDLKVLDTMIGYFLFNENKPLDLKSITDTLFEDMRGYNQHLENYKITHKISKETMVGVPKEVMAFYGACDAVACYRLAKWLKINLVPTAKKRYVQFYLPLIPIYIISEINGISVDLVYANKLRTVYEHRAKKYEQKVFEFSKKEFNINSNKQVADVLYNIFKFPILKYTDGGEPSTDMNVLIELSGNYADNKNVGALKYIIMYKKMTKFISTFIDGMNEHIGPDGRLHYDYKMVLKTGRFSTKSFSIQTMPREDEVRAIIVAKEGYVLVHGDYSQLELRTMANFSNSIEMIKAWENKEDQHSKQAMITFGLKDISEVKKWQRFVGKTMNFALLYGAQAKKVQEIINKGIFQAIILGKLSEDTPLVDLKTIEHGRNMYFKMHPNLKNYISKKRLEIRKTGQAVSIYGLIRHLPNALSSDEYLREEALRMGVNFDIQSPASEVCQTAYKRLGTKLMKIKNPKWIFNLTIHDSIFTEAKNENNIPENCGKYLKKIMLEPLPPNTTVLDVDIEIGNRWAEIPQNILDEYESIIKNYA